MNSTIHYFPPLSIRTHPPCGHDASALPMAELRFFTNPQSNHHRLPERKTALSAPMKGCGKHIGMEAATLHFPYGWL